MLDWRVLQALNHLRGEVEEHPLFRHGNAHVDEHGRRKAAYRWAFAWAQALQEDRELRVQMLLLTGGPPGQRAPERLILQLGSGRRVQGGRFAHIRWAGRREWDSGLGLKPKGECSTIRRRPQLKRQHCPGLVPEFNVIIDRFTTNESRHTWRSIHC